MKDPSAQYCDGDADEERGIAVFADAVVLEELVRQMDELFVGEVDGVGERRDPSGGGRRKAREDTSRT